MRTGRIIGRVWASKKHEDLPGGAMVEIERIPAGGREIAWDPIGCGEEERVLYVHGGSAAKAYKDGSNPLVDCLIVGVLDEGSPGGLLKE